MKKTLIVFSLLAIVLVYFFYPETTITYPAGIMAADVPNQTPMTDEKIWTSGEFTIQALAEYDIKARVLSRNDFSIGKESDLSPLDLALGWGAMSDQSVIDQLDITQSSRWYHWSAKQLPIPVEEISLNSANVHIIPKDEIIEDQFDDVYKGSLIEMKGYLVKVTAEGGWSWISSLRRNDTGGGACELFWVEELKIYPEKDGE